jgi:hypothetical protein
VDGDLRAVQRPSSLTSQRQSNSITGRTSIVPEAAPGIRDAISRACPSSSALHLVVREELLTRLLERSVPGRRRDVPDLDGLRVDVGRNGSPSRKFPLCTSDFVNTSYASTCAWSRASVACDAARSSP